MTSQNTHQKEAARTVLLVEPQTLVRSGLRLLVNSIPGFEVVAEAATLEEAISSLDQHDIDVLLTELALPGNSAIELLLELKRRQAQRPKVIILSVQDSPEVVQRVFGSGAWGFVSKDDDHEQLSRGLRAVHANERYLSPLLEHCRSRMSQTGSSSTATAVDPLGELSNREKEIFHLLASGLQNNVIAKKLHISPRTVETHRARIVRKLGLASNGELIRFAIKHGLAGI